MIRLREFVSSYFRENTWAPPLLGLVVLYAAFGLANPRFLEIDNLQAILNQSAIPITVGVGATLVILLGEIDLSVEGIMATSSMVAALLVANQLTEIDLGYLAFLLATAVGMLMGLLNGLLSAKLKISSFMTTFAMWFIGLGVASWLFDIGGGQAPRLLNMEMRQLAFPSLFGLSPITYIGISILALGWIFQRFTVFGRHAYAIGNDVKVARESGVRIDRTKLLIFAMAGACAGLGGVMAALRGGVGSVRTGEGMVFVVISSVVIGGTFLTGGRGGVINTLIGVLITIGLRNGLVILGINPFLQQTVQGLILLAVVVASTWQLRSRLRIVK